MCWRQCWRQRSQRSPSHNLLRELVWIRLWPLIWLSLEVWLSLSSSAELVCCISKVFRIFQKYLWRFLSWILYRRPARCQLTFCRAHFKLDLKSSTFGKMLWGKMALKLIVVILSGWESWSIDVKQPNWKKRKLEDCRVAGQRPDWMTEFIAANKITASW